MPRIKPIDKDNENLVVMSATVAPKLLKQVDDEVKRVGLKTRSELIRLILVQYFEEEIEG